jgi:hypothetical protein
MQQPAAGSHNNVFQHIETVRVLMEGLNTQELVATPAFIDEWLGKPIHLPKCDAF